MWQTMARPAGQTEAARVCDNPKVPVGGCTVLFLVRRNRKVG